MSPARIAEFVLRFLPPCNFKRLFSLPCPSCGTGRATVALIRGDVASALALNPLFVATVGFSLVLAAWAVVIRVRRGRFPVIEVSARSGKRALFGFAAAVLANWCYLLLSL